MPFAIANLPSFRIGSCRTPHGPLIATLLVDLLRRALPDARIARFTFRAVSPLFDTAPFFVRGQPAPGGGSVHLWAANVHGGLAMDATATLASA